MKKYEEGIDFVIISYALPDYVKQCVKSIDLFFKDTPKTIHVVCNYLDKEEEMSVLREMFPQSHVKIHAGADQNDGQIRKEGSVYCNSDGRLGILDNNSKARGGYYGSIGNNIGIKSGNRKYICHVHQDSIFLNECADELMKLTEKYCFISNRWCPGTVFKECSNVTSLTGMAREMMLFTRREFYDDMESENYIERGLWQMGPINVDWRDEFGNLTWYAQRKDKEFLILKNTFWDEPRRRKHNIKEWETSPWHRSKEDQVFYIDWNNEQCWIEDKPIHFHLGRGGLHSGKDRIKKWVNLTNEYLSKKEEGVLNV
tara:strand:+ start:527 stop:1468 length:942 start_codon:yes stop_codon:yes gene_type:complete